jgi:hypothetical protein
MLIYRIVKLSVSPLNDSIIIVIYDSIIYLNNDILFVHKTVVNINLTL